MSNFIVQIFKFISVGFVVTILTLFLNYFFVKFLNTDIYYTYASIYLISILLSFVLNSFFVFKTKISLANNFRYLILYLLSLGIGLLLMKNIEKLIDVESWYYPFFVLPFTMSFNFFGSKLLLVK
jgi:putative flippase GtrA